MFGPSVLELSDRRLVYRPWKVGSAVWFFVIGVIMLGGGVLWTHLHGTPLQSLTWWFLIAVAITLKGFFYIWKNAEALVFDVTTGRIARKLPLLPEREISRFNEIYGISSVAEMNTFNYILTRKSQTGGGEIPISDTFYSNVMKPDRQAFEDNILPVIATMLNIQPR